MCKTRKTEFFYISKHDTVIHDKHAFYVVLSNFLDYQNEREFCPFKLNLPHDSSLKIISFILLRELQRFDARFQLFSI